MNVGLTTSQLPRKYIVLILLLLIFSVILITRPLRFPLILSTSTDTELNVSTPVSSEGQYKKPQERATGKEGATDIPSWAKGEKPLVGESGQEFAKRISDKKYGAGNYPGSEFNKLKKYGDRHFE